MIAATAVTSAQGATSASSCKFPSQESDWTILSRAPEVYEAEVVGVAAHVCSWQGDFITDCGTYKVKPARPLVGHLPIKQRRFRFESLWSDDSRPMMGFEPAKGDLVVIAEFPRDRVVVPSGCVKSLPGR